MNILQLIGQIVAVNVLVVMSASLLVCALGGTWLKKVEKDEQRALRAMGE